MTEKEGKTARERERVLPPSASIPKYSQWPGLAQAGVGILEYNSSLPLGGKGPSISWAATQYVGKLG